jgi:hypothetical protein
MQDRKIDFDDEHVWFCYIQYKTSGVVELIINTHERWQEFELISPMKFKVNEKEYELETFLPDNVPVVSAILREKDQIVVEFIPVKIIEPVEGVTSGKGYTIIKHSEELISLVFDKKYEKYHAFNEQTYLLGKDLDDEFSFSECLNIPKFLPENTENFYVDHEINDPNFLRFLFISSALLL